MSGNFRDFEDKFGGKAFAIFSARTGLKEDIVNQEVIEAIGKEIERLKKAGLQYLFKSLVLRIA